MKIWYMRDNHTFCRLPHDVESAIAILRDEYAAGNNYGMLCNDGSRPCTSMTIDRDAHGRADFAEFEPRARRWLAAELAYKSPADLECESWKAVGAPVPQVEASDAVRPSDTEDENFFIGSDGFLRCANCGQIDGGVS